MAAVGTETGMEMTGNEYYMVWSVFQKGQRPGSRRREICQPFDLQLLKSIANFRKIGQL